MWVKMNAVILISGFVMNFKFSFVVIIYLWNVQEGKGVVIF